MANDTISRSALVAELEAFKMSLGDIVLRYVVDRVIDLVKAWPAVKIYTPKKLCENCKHWDRPLAELPCRICNKANDRTHWEPCG